MKCRLKRLTLACAALSLSSCVHAPPPVDSFCQIYNRVVLQKGDGSISATPGVKRRILANELTYKDQCTVKQK